MTTPARKRFGQHFLEPVWADKVVAAIAPQSGDRFLEIGPGRGVLTMRLACRVARLTAVEIDRDLIADLALRVPGNVALVSGDFLRVDSRALSAEISTLSPEASPGVESVPFPVRVAGNLPYNVASPILFRLLELQPALGITDATVMLQKEVADRIVARPGSADYGVLSVLLQWKAEAVKVLTLPPGAFRPAPRVTSALIRLTFRPAAFSVADAGGFERLVRSVFLQRRKTLANALKSYAERTPVSALDALRRAGIDPARRPQTLQLVEIARLADAFHGALV